MTITRVFKSGNSQAVRLPKKFSVQCSELEIFRRGDEIILRQPSKGFERAFEILTELPNDCFSDSRVDPLPQDREGF